MGPDVALELYVRSLAPRGDGGRLDRVLEDLSRLAATDGVADYDVTVWGDAVRTDGPAAVTGPGAEALAAVEAFAAFADRRGADFPVSTAARGTLADDARSVVELPPVALAEYRGGDLARVTPVVRADGVETVEDHVASLLAQRRHDAGDAEDAGERAGDELLVDAN